MVSLHWPLYILPHPQGFDHHVTHDHNMWDYIYYSIYLDQIDVSDHNAIEQFVSREVRILYIASSTIN